jgi:hypothetical protein
MDSINISPSDPCASIDNDTLPNGIKVNVVPIDKLPDDQREKLMNIPARPGPRRIEATGWFRKF